MNRDGYKFDINVRRNGFMSYLWSAEVEDEGFFTPIATVLPTLSTAARKPL